MGIVMIVGSQCDGDSDDSGESVCPIIFCTGSAGLFWKGCKTVVVVVIICRYLTGALCRVIVMWCRRFR